MRPDVITKGGRWTWVILLFEIDSITFLLSVFHLDPHSELQTPLTLHVGTTNQTLKVTEIILIDNWPKSGCLWGGLAALVWRPEPGVWFSCQSQRCPWCSRSDRPCPSAPPCHPAVGRPRGWEQGQRTGACKGLAGSQGGTGPDWAAFLRGWGQGGRSPDGRRGAEWRRRMDKHQPSHQHMNLLLKDIYYIGVDCLSFFLSYRVVFHLLLRGNFNSLISVWNTNIFPQDCTKVLIWYK